MSNSSSSTQALPSVPHPSGLLGTSSTAYIALNESKHGRDNLDRFKQSLVAGAAGYNLDPPGASSLPPLPPIPLPPKRYSKPVSPPSKTVQPVLRPAIPESSPFAPVRCTTLADCVDAVRGAGYPACGKLNDTAMSVNLMAFGAAWIFLKQSAGEEVEVESIRMYTPADPMPPPVHSVSSDPPTRALSQHLTSLKLTLPELLWRLLALPQSADQSCVFCNKRLHPSDGLSTETGWLPSSGSDEVDKAEKAGEGDVPMGTEESGKWVHWHPSCRPA